jgi:hypothetical protein
MPEQFEHLHPDGPKQHELSHMHAPVVEDRWGKPLLVCLPGER